MMLHSQINHFNQLLTLIITGVFLAFNVFTYVTSVCIDTSELTQESVYLENNLIGVTLTSSLLDCAADCSTHSDCLSFGFEPRTRSCHLHSENSNTASGGLRERVSWLHGDIDIWPKAIGGACSNHSCSSGDRCRIQRVSDTPRCEKANYVLPFGYCPSPADILNAHISDGQQQEGSVRTYTCNYGYLDTSSEKNSTVTTCLDSGEWSPVSLNCSGPYIRLETPWLDDFIFTPIPPETFYNITGNNSSLIFLSKTCKDTDVSLYIEPIQNGDTGIYVVVIGGWKNSRSVIRECSACTPLVTHSETDILHCDEFRPFWLSWMDGTISVGKGSLVGDQVFMEWTPVEPFSVTGAGLSSYKRNSGSWLFSYQV